MWLIIGLVVGAVVMAGFYWLNTLGGKATQDEIDRECERIRAEMKRGKVYGGDGKDETKPPEGG